MHKLDRIEGSPADSIRRRWPPHGRDRALDESAAPGRLAQAQRPLDVRQERVEVERLRKHPVRAGVALAAVEAADQDDRDTACGREGP